MAGLWPRTGNVTVTNGSKIVTGFGTKWKTGTLPIQKGHTFYGPDNFAYEVDTVVSDESLTLVEAYRGGTLANQGYRIDITRTSTISQFAADLASLVAKYRSWFDGMMTWLTGSGDVAILNPDTGANVTIPSWKKVASEGEGQTARAKVEADRAKTEADRALTEADRAAGIVALAALPMPDVWAPLSDSLRLITGYGRDVLVGSDVVARMVNFSRSTTASYKGKDGQQKSAAVNEPRFEREGLLNELQSTNLIQTPGTLTTQTIQVSAGTHTLSFWGVGSVTLSGAATGTLVGVGASDRVAMTFTATAGVLTLTVAGVCSNGQIEALPFATSYMQPSGAAVTRVPDATYLPAAGNRFAFQGFTVAFEWDLLGVSDRIEDNRLIDLDNDASSSRHYVGVSQARRLVAMFGTNKIVSQSAVMSGLCVLVVNGPSFSLYNNGSKIGTATVTGRAETANARLYLLCNNTGLFQSAGHMRNLRIWHRALSEAQIKAIA
ncbi:LamG-like jellyroll fold domain-containing protein [Aeromonas caviae]|uniref:LamG-like jellyroll fold domain-containing protein n=1 Tax=Aeromonas caviae TaxID=648 RepID=UPI002B4975C2|nr:LamG-like jellyroll fold domain-containing protein [Aeromonas caviae]